VSESPFLHRSLLQFSDLVHALASRSTAEHVPWRGGKLTSLLHGKLGVNALTLSVATVRCGQPKCSAATLALASRMRDVLCYPVLNTAAAQGLLTISRSEILALKEDLSQMVAKGIETLSPSRPPSEAGRAQPPRKKLDLVDTLQNPIKMATPRGTQPAQPAQPATKATPPKEEEEEQGVSEDEDEDEDFDGDLEAENAYLKSKLAKYKSRMAAAVSKPTPPLDPLVQSNLQGKLIQAELQAEQLRAARAAAVKERVELQKEYTRLLGEKQEVERHLLDAEHERLKVAKALVDLQVEGSAQSTVTEEQKMELDRKILSSEAEKHALAREIEGFARQVAQLEDDLRVSQAEKEDLVHELLAARQSLEMQRQQGMALVSDARERDLEIVRSVKEAEHKGAQVEAQAQALVTARAATEVIRQQLHAAESRSTSLDAQVAALKRDAALARAKQEELQMAARRAAVQRELFEVSVAKERAELLLQRQQLKDELAEGQRQVRDEGLRQAKGAEELAKQRLAEVVSCRAEITQLKDQRAELEMRVSTLEVAVDAGEQQLQAAHEFFRQSLRDALAVHFEGGSEADQQADQ